MKKQRFLSALLVLCMLFSLLPGKARAAGGAEDFTDVARDSWCYDYVDDVTSRGYFHGTTGTTFSPNRNMTRAMFVVVLARFDGAKVNNSQSAFVDVASNSWCAGAINWAAAHDIVGGRGNGLFAPNEPITRAQMCAIMDRYLDYYAQSERVQFAKSGRGDRLADEGLIPAYAQRAVRHCQEYGLVNGYSDGTFRPQDLSTRAHVAAVIYRLRHLVEDADPVKKPSKPGHGGGSHGGGGGPSYYTYRLAYNVNGGSADSAPAVQSSEKTTAASWTTTVSDKIPTHQNSLLEFKGWSHRGDETAVHYLPKASITLRDSRTLYAFWQARDGVITLRGEQAETAGRTFYADGSFAVDAPKRGGYRFTGWTDASGKTYAAGEKLPAPTEKVILTAGWEEDTSTHTAYTVRFYNGDALHAAVTTEKNGAAEKAFTLPAAPTREGYAFTGWATKDGKLTFAPDAANCKAGSDLELYAQWRNSGDLIGGAVEKAMKQVNENYVSKLPALVEGSGVAVQPLVYQGGGEDLKAPRPQQINVTVSMTEQLALSVMEAAGKTACRILADFDQAPTQSEVDRIVDAVVEQVRQSIGLDLRNPQQFKEQLAAKLKESVTTLWHDDFFEEGKPVTGKITVTAGAATVTMPVSAAGELSLAGSKEEAVKNLSVELAKQMFAQLRRNTAYTGKVTLPAQLTVTFSPSQAYQATTDQYAYEYPLTICLTADGGGLVEYKFEGGQDFLKVHPTPALQQAYSEAVLEMSKAAMTNKQLTEKLCAKADEQLMPGSRLYSAVDEALGKLRTKLEGYGVTMETTTADVMTALAPRMHAWVEANLSTDATPAGADYVLPYDFFWTQGKKHTQLSGKVLGDHEALIDAVWAVVVEKDLSYEMVGDRAAGKLVDNLVAAVTKKMESTQVTHPTTGQKVPLDEDYLIAVVKENNMVKQIVDMLGQEGTRVIPAQVADVLKNPTLEGINTLFAINKVSVILNGGIEAGIGTDKAPFNVSLKETVLEKAQAEFDKAVGQLTQSHPEAAELLGKHPELKDYVLYRALTALGLEGFDRFEEISKESDAEGHLVLRPTGKYLGYAVDEDKTLATLQDVAKETARSTMQDRLMTEIERVLGTHAQQLEQVYRLRAVKTYGELRTVQARELAEMLRSKTLQDALTGKGAEYAAKLRAAIGKLPEGASVTLDGVVLSKTALSALGNAQDLAQACTAMAGLLDGFGERSIADFADETGRTVSIQAKGREINFQLVIAAQ